MTPRDQIVLLGIAVFILLLLAFSFWYSHQVPL
jgi:hypothetical protein